MFKRKDLRPLFFLLVLICFIMVTLSQILAVHQKNRYTKPLWKLEISSKHSDSEILNGRKINIDPSSMFGFNVESQKLLNEIYVSRIASLIRLASNVSKFLLSHDEFPTTNEANSFSSNGFGSNILRSVTSSSTNIDDNIYYKNNNNNNNNDTTKNMEDSVTKRSFGNNKTYDKNIKNSRVLHLSLTKKWDTESNLNGTTAKQNEITQHNNNILQTNNGNDSLKNDYKKSGLDSIYNSRNKSQLQTIEHLKKFRISEYCPEVPPNLQGKLNITFNVTGEIQVKNIIKSNKDLKSGGSWTPPDCISRHRVAIIIPYRDRQQHLVTLLYYLIPILKKQQLDFRVFVVEQYGNETFNKGRIMNAAFKEALKLFTFHCCVFHDVDLIPEDDRNMYSCPEYPRHLSVAVDEMEYRLPYELLVGGVLNLRTDHFQRVNGYSNHYWGWGAEDDDMAYRIKYSKLKITRPPVAVARFKMIRHKKRKPAPWSKRGRLLRATHKRFRSDGLNNIRYKVIFSHKDPIFTHFMVDIGSPKRNI